MVYSTYLYDGTADREHALTFWDLTRSGLISMRAMIIAVQILGRGGRRDVLLTRTSPRPKTREAICSEYDGQTV
ncbi:hypothetical protein K443DRAFT_575304 [Laccaria amethystina LaAM-08-1]|jgi:hypothetical protein|uniref:Uncharacterized protein n=1 Tax=Laccaria amethystina LaAM-08-1 TaxID=1095629 RepID=A0A0C9XU23_9AGAR|nr:hypothetical protein K443DRAFT_575304 [Laccaria amethystina LaAM-08-1]